MGYEPGDCTAGQTTFPDECTRHHSHYWCRWCAGYYGVPHDNNGRTCHTGPRPVSHPSDQCGDRFCKVADEYGMEEAQRLRTERIKNPVEEPSEDLAVYSPIIDPTWEDYPLTTMRSRYGGAVETAEWVAFGCHPHEIPKAFYVQNHVCSEAYERYGEWIGTGRTAQDAANDLIAKRKAMRPRRKRVLGRR